MPPASAGVSFTWYMAFHAELTATEIGFYQALVLSPFLVFTISGGALTDRIGAGLSYIVSTSIFATILTSYGILDLQFGFVPELFFLYCVCAGIVSAVSNPAIDTFIPGATDQPVQDNSLLAATAHNIAKLTGNVSGLLLPVLSATGGFVANGLLMAISVIFLRAHRHGVPRNMSRHIGQPNFKHGIFRRITVHYQTCPENFDILLSSALLGLIIVPAGYILVPLTLRERFPDYGDMIALIGISSWIGAKGHTSSSDGQFFPTTRQGEAMNLINAKYDTHGPGLKAYTHVSDRFGPFWIRSIPATVNEAPYALDGL